MTHLRHAFLALAVVLAGCSSAASAPTVAPSGATASGPVAAPIDSPEAAAAAVLAADTRFRRLGPFDPNAIGQCCGYRVTAGASGWTVTVEVGWGDCPAGCIDRHTWVFAVDRDGRVELQRESGPAVPAGLPGSGAGGTTAGSASPSDDGTGPTTSQGIVGTATSGPTCPVVRSGDTSCADRPVAGATIHIRTADGTEVATLTTDAAGRFATELEAGAYVVAAEPVPGMMGQPTPLDVTVPVGVARVQLVFDTGIR